MIDFSKLEIFEKADNKGHRSPVVLALLLHKEGVRGGYHEKINQERLSV